MPADEPISPDDVRVGDEVLIRATVVSLPDRARGEVKVELFSKTDQYNAVVRLDLIETVLMLFPSVAEEPPDGTWLAGETNEDTGNASVFRRDDAEGHCDQPIRRYDRHWWDFAASEWIDWPTAIRRGADPRRRLEEVRRG